jgi:hypothetical protein
MTDFKAAYTIGQQAAVDAKRAKAEIKQVLDALFVAVAEVSDQKVRLRLEEFPKGGYGGLSALSARVVKAVNGELPYPTEWWITGGAIGEQDRVVAKLARWEESDAGYPCVIRYSSIEDRCHNRTALERSLAAFLSNPWVAERLRDITDKASPRAAGDGAGAPDVTP